MSFMTYVKSSFSSGKDAYSPLDVLVKDKKSTAYGLTVVMFAGVLMGFRSGNPVESLINIILYPLILSSFMLFMHLVARYVFRTKVSFVHVFRAACTAYVLVIPLGLLSLIPLFLPANFPEEVQYVLSIFGLIGFFFFLWALWRFVCVTNYLYKLPMWKYILSLLAPIVVFIFAFFSLLRMSG